MGIKFNPSGADPYVENIYGMVSKMALADWEKERKKKQMQETLKELGIDPAGMFGEQGLGQRGRYSPEAFRKAPAEEISALMPQGGWTPGQGLPFKPMGAGGRAGTASIKPGIMGEGFGTSSLRGKAYISGLDLESGMPKISFMKPKEKKELSVRERILDKVSKGGMKSLEPGEKTIYNEIFKKKTDKQFVYDPVLTEKIFNTITSPEELEEIIDKPNEYKKAGVDVPDLIRRFYNNPIARKEPAIWRKLLKLIVAGE